MRAAKDAELNENGEQVKDKKGKCKNDQCYCKLRVSPLKNSAIISVTSVHPEQNWSSMARQEGDAVPYEKQEYCAIMKGMFSLDLSMVGTFSNYDRTGFKKSISNFKWRSVEKWSWRNRRSLVFDSKGRK